MGAGGLASFTRQIPGGGKQSIINARGTTIILRRSGTFVVTVRPRSSQIGGERISGESYELEMHQGEKWFTATEFDAVEVTNDSADDVEVIFLIGYGDYVEPPPNLGSSDKIQTAQPGPVAISGESAATLLAAKNSKRWRVHIRNPSDTYTLWIGGVSTVEEDDGWPIYPNESMTHETRGDIYGVYDSTATGQEIPAYISEELFE